MINSIFAVTKEVVDHQESIRSAFEKMEPNGSYLDGVKDVFITDSKSFYDQYKAAQKTTDLNDDGMLKIGAARVIGSFQKSIVENAKTRMCYFRDFMANSYRHSATSIIQSTVTEKLIKEIT